MEFITKSHRLLTCALIFIIFSCTDRNSDVPGKLNSTMTGWWRAGSKSNSYKVFMEQTGDDGRNVATIKSIDEKIDGFETLMQKCLPDKYLGKRIRMSGSIKTQDLSDWGGLWLRIDSGEPGKTLGFDNMHDGKTDRSIRGTTPWTKYEIVLNVPTSTTYLAYGTLLTGQGQIWFGDLSFEIVDDDIPTTGYDF